MKKSNKIMVGVGGTIAFILIVITMTFQTCCAQSDNLLSVKPSSVSKSKEIIGNKQIISKTIPISNFNSVNISGAFNVNIQPGKTGGLTLKTDDNLLPYMRVTQSNSSLYISTQPEVMLSPSQTPIITLTTGNPVTNINLDGKTILDAQLDTNKLILSANGKSQIKLQANIKDLIINVRGKNESHIKLNNANSVSLNIGGKAIIYLSGQAKNLTITAGGKATILAADLIADNVTVLGAGKADATVHAVKSLNITTMGKSDVKYYGEPKVNKTSFGETAVEKMSKSNN